MKIGNKHHHSIWRKPGEPSVIQIIDQRFLPHRVEIEDLRSAADVRRAIQEMHVRGAPLIGACAAYGMYLAALDAPTDSSFYSHMEQVAQELKASRPTAVNLSWAVDEILAVMRTEDCAANKIARASARADEIVEEELVRSRKIGEFGLPLIEQLCEFKRGETVNILTHCNAGWIACIDYGTATSPIYMAHEQGIPVHVWVDETRPRSQGAKLTAWELGEHGIPHTIIPDTASGHVMQQGKVDMVIVGTDRTAKNGDVVNKIGTYLVALAAHANAIPFYVALPSSSLDWESATGEAVTIEERNAREVKYVQGLAGGETAEVLISPQSSPAANFAFDVTPRSLVTGFITEHGLIEPNEEGLRQLCH